MTRNGNFFNLYNHDFIRIAVGVPSVRVADPAYNAEHTIALIRDAAERKAVLVLFPELGLSAYSCDDLFQQRALLDACLDAIAAVVEASAKLPIVSVVGAPLEIDHHLHNCAVVIHRGKILGVVPKTNLPNYREFYEPRQFTSADAAMRDEIDLAGSRAVPFGNNLIFQHEEQPLLTFHAEICEDLWVPIPPSSYAALAGATVLLNLSASNRFRPRFQSRRVRGRSSAGASQGPGPGCRKLRRIARRAWPDPMAHMESARSASATASSRVAATRLRMRSAESAGLDRAHAERCRRTCSGASAPAKDVRDRAPRKSLAADP